ncbi:hypothetical protein D3C80_1442220 [compost metagenome]
MSHSENRRDADSASKQHVVIAAEIERKQVTWGSDGELRPFLHIQVHTTGAATRFGFMQYSDGVLAAVIRRVAQRVLTNQPGCNVHVDVSASSKGGQGPTVDR